MVTNLFELLNAPTSLKPKDLSTHIRMQMSLPEETRNICSRDLFRMDIKLMNELTTVRFSRKLPKEDDPDYQAFCDGLAVKGVEPIPYKYFAGEYALMKAESGRPKDNIKKLTDPWRVQAYAAQYLRFAQNAETGKTDSATALWLLAVRQYKQFFSMAKVEESYTFQYAPDDDARNLCRETWDRFLPILLEQLNDRRKEYISKKNAESAAVCLKVLKESEIRAIVPDAYAQALKESFAPFVTAVKSAATLETAGEMYGNCPKDLREADTNHELELAMLAAIRAELNRRKAVKEPANEVPEWLRKLQVKRLYTSGGVMEKIDAKAVLEDCADYIRFALDSKEPEILACACRICSADIFPDDVFIGKGSDGDLFRPDVAPLLLGALAKTLAEKNLGKPTKAKAEALGKKLAGIANEMGRDQTAYSAITACINHLITNDADADVLLAFLNVFDDSIPLKDPNCSTVGALKKKFGGDPGVKLLKELADLDCGNRKYPDKVDEVLAYVKKNGNNRIGSDKLSDLAKKVLMSEFISCANHYQKTPSDPLLHTLEKLANWLGMDTEVPAGEGRTISIRKIMNGVRGNPALKCFKDLQEADTGSMAESKAVDAVIQQAQTKGGEEAQDGMTILELARRILLNTYVGNANEYQRNESSVSRKIMRRISSWLPADTELPGGQGQTLREFEDRLELMKALTEIRPRLENQTWTESDVHRLCYLISEWPDADLGGSTFREIAESYLHSMLVVCANNLQRRGSSEWQDKFLLVFSMSHYYSFKPGEADALIKVIDHYGLGGRLSIHSGKPNYRPEYPPYGSPDDKKKKKKKPASSGQGKTKKKGFFAWLRGLFTRK